MELLLSHDSYVNLAFSPAFMVVNSTDGADADADEELIFNISP